MAITDWPKADRPREKLLIYGARHLTDAEILAILIHSGCRGQTALDLAKKWLTEFGDLKHLFDYLISSTKPLFGLGGAKLTALLAARELGWRLQTIKINRGDKFDNSYTTEAYLLAQLKDHANEVFACLFLDTHFRLLKFAELFHGTIDHANIYPREIVRRSLLLNAAKVIIAHNHPSGEIKPSAADLNMTQIIKQALALVEVELVDHLIIGKQACYSFARMGDL